MSFPTLPGGAPAVLMTPERMTWLNDLGLLSLNSIFGTVGADEGSGFDALLRRTIQNFADAERATSYRQNLLSYTAAAELFFTRPHDTTVAVCHGIARILSEDVGRDFNEMLRLANAMYDAPSRTIHDGTGTPVPERDRPAAAAPYRSTERWGERRGPDLWGSV
jgi:hypothetical protein